MTSSFFTAFTTFGPGPTIDYGTSSTPTETSGPVQAADNSTPLNRGIPKGIGITGRRGEIIVDPDHFGGVRLINSRAIVTLVLGFQDTDLGGAASLLWLKADEEFVYRAQTPTRDVPSDMQIYDGTQTAVDPTILAALGATETTMWPGLAYIVLKDFDVTKYDGRIPVFLGAWATDATAVASSTTSSTATFGSFGSYFYASMSVDYSTNLAYLMLAGAAGEPAIVTTIDICTETEVNRATLSSTDSVSFSDFSEYSTSLEGSDYTVATLTSKVAIADNNILGLVMFNTRTGEVVARLDAVYVGAPDDGYFEPGVWGSILLRSDSATKYLVLCNMWASIGISQAGVPASYFTAVIADITNGTLEYVVHPSLYPIRSIPTPGSYASPLAYTLASVTDGAAVIYWVDENDDQAKVWKTTITESGANGAELVYTHTSDLHGVAYDIIDNALVMVDGNDFITKYDLDTSTQTYTVDQSVIAGASNLWINVVTDASHWTGFHLMKPGYGVVMKSNNDMYLCDFSDGSLSLLSTNTVEYGSTFDQYRGVVIYPHTGTDGLIKFDRLGDLTPNSIDGTEIITSLMTYNGDYVAGDLTFTNFAGGEAEGLDVAFDTTIDSLMRDVTATMGVREVHDGGKVKFSTPPRDGAYAVDVTLTDNDITADGINQTIDDEDSAFERTLVSYSDVDVDFNRVTQEFARPNGSYEVLKSNKRRSINTSLVMTAPQAAKAAQRITYESDLDHTRFEMAVMPSQFSIEPSAIAQFSYGPNAELTIVGEVRRASINEDLSQSLEITEYLQAIETVFSGTSLVTVAPLCNPAVPSNLTILDTALLSYGDDLAGSGLRGYALLSGIGTADIGNSIIYLSEDGFSYTAAGSRSEIAPIGGSITALTGTLPDSFQTDFVNTMDVTVSSGDISIMASTDEAGRYSLVNFAAVGRQGRWVLISYEIVSTSGQIATLSNIIWGVRGTEVYTSQLAVGDEFHNIEADEYTRYGSAVSTLDAELFLKAGSTTFEIWQLSTIKHTADGEAEKPYAPVEVAGVDNAGDVDLTWEFRERLDPLPVLYGSKAAGYSDGTDFEIDIVGGSPPAVLRTLTSATNSVTYSSANFITDFGSPTPSTFTARAYHMSGLGMRGHQAEATITP